MADFRRCIFVLAALAVVFGAATTASAQNYVCTASVANPPLLRAEELTALTGDVVLVCNGFSVSTLSTVVNIQIFLNTNVTSRILANGGTEGLLLINDPAPGAQVPGAPGVPGVNIYQGSLVAANSVAFLGVTLPPVPAASNQVSLRITNIRANANGLGVASASAPPNPVIETISISSGVTVSNPNQTVGFVTRGLVLASTPVTSVGTFLQCTSTGIVASGFAGPAAAFTINFGEGFPTAFKLQGGGPATTAPGTVNNTESGLIPSTSITALVGAGQADFGTRVRLTFANIGAGAIILVPTTLPSNGVVGTTARAVLVSSQTQTSTPGAITGPNAAGFTFSASLPSPLLAATNTIGGINYAQVTPTAGVATATYEIIATNSNAIDTFAVPVFLSFVASPGTNSPALGTVTVAVSFAPTSTVTTATNSSAPVPRFADTGAAVSAFAINSCATNLLFPFVTNIAGFDTGLAISNTSTDPFGTATQSGTCTLNFFGNTAPAAFTTPNPVASGAVYTNLLSSIASGFQGYIIATCRFQFAHGFAFLTDGFGGPGRGLSQGYLALVIPDVNATGGARMPNPNVFAGVNSGEQLGY